MSNEKDICYEIEENDFYKVFLQDNSNKSPIANMTISNQIQELSKGLEAISSELQSQVREKHGALLSQATNASKLDTALNSVSDNVERIQLSAQRLKDHVDSQFVTIENQTKVLGRLHEVSHKLRSCGNVLHLTNKLKMTKDTLKQASLHYELEPLIDDADLAKLEIIQEERAYVISSRQKIKNLSQMQLVTNLKDRNKDQVINSLKIFMNLHTLEKSIDNLITTYVTEIKQSIKECFAGTDITSLSSSNTLNDNSRPINKPSINSNSMRGPGKTPLLTTTQNFRAKFWKSLHWLIFDELHEYCLQMILLKECLKEINQILFVSDDGKNVCTKFWISVGNLLKKSFTECPVHISQALEERLSTLLNSVRGLESRLAFKFVFDNEIFKPFEAGYLSKCNENLKCCFNGIDLPSNDTIDNFIQVASSEFSVAMVDNQLANLVASVFISINKDFWTKIEAQIKFGTDSKQVVDIPNTSQMQNINLANIIFYHSDSIKRMIWNLGETFSKSTTADKLIKSLDEGNRLIQAILQQLLDSIISTVNIILLSMHREPGLNSDKLSIVGPSMYMKELQEFLQRSWINHITPFDDRETTRKCGEQLAIRCIELFVNNLSVLRPLTTAGRNRLKNDCNHLENALKIIVPNLSTLGKPFRLLRAMSALIVQNAEELVKQDINKESPVPCYIILLLLFSHGGAELQSPHTAANWSNERLIQWLDGHTSDNEKLELISGALQRYRDNIRRKNGSQYDPIYPHLASYFEMAYKSL